MQPFVKIENVSMSFSEKGAFALDSISAELFSGQMVGLVGPDGAGKTTLMRLISGLLIPTSGKITIGGLDATEDSEKVHETLGYMPQRFGLYEDLSVIENLELYSELRSIDPKTRKERFHELLEFTRLKPFQKRLAKNLSGGMKQKLGLACALIKKPKLLLLDEPSVGVDPVSRCELWEMVRSLLDEKIAILWSTAYLDEAEKCQTTLLLNEGKLKFLGSPEKLTQRVEKRVFSFKPQGEKRASLKECMQNEAVLDGVIQGDSIRLVLKPGKTILNLELKEDTPRFEDAFVDILSEDMKEEKKDLTVSINGNETVKEPIIADHLTKKYGDFTAANEVNFKVKKGEIFGLLGPNGAGKSTTFKMLSSLSKPTGGRAIINGVDVALSLSEARLQFGYMAQKFSLYGNLSVLRNLEFFASAYQLEKERKKEAIDRLVDIFSLSSVLNRNCDTLPIGFKQRVAFAAAIMHEPKVLFLDEPTSGMDPLNRRLFWRQVNSLAMGGCTVMVTTHFMDEAENCDRIALLYRSKMIYLGTSDDLKEKAKSKDLPNPTLDDAFIKLIEENHA